MMRFFVPICAIVPLLGCSNSHNAAERDAEVRRDAEVQRDAEVRRDAEVQRDAEVHRDGEVPRDATAAGPVRGGFELTLQLRPEADRDQVPDTHRFTAWVDMQSTTVVAGRSGEVSSAPLTWDGEQLEMDGMLELPLGDTHGSGCQYAGPVDYTELTLVPHDSDGDGRIDRVSGSAQGNLLLVHGDVAEQLPFTAEITDGPRDRTPPTLSGPNGQGPHHVLDRLVVRSSEPLRRSTNAFFQRRDGTRVELTPQPADGAAIGRFVSEGILPLGATLTLNVAPELNDLAGTGPVSPDLTVTTIDPGVFPEDGFEGADPAAGVHLDGGAELVSSVGNLGAIEGSRSLLIPPGGRATLRLRGRGIGGVSGTIQLLGQHRSANFFGDIQLHPVSGEEPHSAALEDLSLGPDAAETGAEPWAYASSERDFTVWLDSAAEGDVLLDILNQEIVCGPRPAPSALLIDQLGVIETVPTE
jgi:hypothetical protein